MNDVNSPLSGVHDLVLLFDPKGERGRFHVGPLG